jgi:hypothetical protein
VTLAGLSYGRLYDGLKEIGLSGALVRHRYLLPVYAIAVGAGIVWCARRQGRR